MENKIQISGKIAKFPDNTNTVKALEFLQKVKVNPNKLWYIIVEDQGTDLKMVKYNRNKGVNLIDYTNKLKEYYIQKYEKNQELVEKLNYIEVVGENEFSVIKNIPLIKVGEDKTLISKIANDLINILAE